MRLLDAFCGEGGAGMGYHRAGWDVFGVDNAPARLRLVMDRHRLFESNALLMAPEHLKHDRSVQVAGSYGGARRDKREAREIRKGGYVPSADVQRALLDAPWMSEKGCQLSIPPAYTQHIGEQLLSLLGEAAA